MGLLTPNFWFRPLGAEGILLSPLGHAYAALGKLRRTVVCAAKGTSPLVVVGNIVAGGAGKTPVTLALAQALLAQGVNVHLLAKGYGGTIKRPTRVDPERHTAKDVGDEPLLLARIAPTWIAHDRGAGWEAASRAGAQIVLSDDGFQSPRLKPDYALLVVDGVVGLGNGRLIPAGPLREKAEEALKRANAVIQIGGYSPRLASEGVPTLYADYVLNEPEWMAGARLFPFAGLGRPEKFFAACHTSGAEVPDTMAFPDHHPYTEKDMRTIIARADALGAVAVTTAKDHVRVPADYRRQIRVLDGKLVWRDASAFAGLVTCIVECMEEVERMKKKQSIP